MKRSRPYIFRHEYRHRRRLGAGVLVALCTALNWAVWGKTRWVVYVSGPMRGIRDFNFPAFHRAAAYLRSERGWWVLNPAEMGDKPGWEWPDYMRRDIAAVAESNAIVMLDGWEGSKGAGEEKHAAEVFGCVVYYIVEGNFEEDALFGPRLALQRQPHEPELGRLDVTFTVVTRNNVGDLIAAPKTAAAYARDIIASLRQPGRVYPFPLYDLDCPEGPERSLVAEIEGPVIHSSAATIDQGFTKGIEGLDYHEEAFSNGD